MTRSSTPVSRRCLLATIFGSKLESRSRGTLSSTGPGPGEHRLGRVTVSGIPAIPAGRVVLAVAEVVVQLALPGALDPHLGQSSWHAWRTGTPALRHLPSGYIQVNTAWMWGALLAASIAGWLHQLTAATRGRAILACHGVRGGKAMIATLSSCSSPSPAHSSSTPCS